MMNRRIVEMGGRKWWVVSNQHGAATYEPGPRHATINVHMREETRDGMSLSSDVCEFLDGECRCWFDGTSLATNLTAQESSDDAIFAELERWLRSYVRRPWYVEYRSGNCTIVRASDKQQALEVAGPSRVVGDGSALLARPATQTDLDHFERMGGMIR